MNELRPNLDRRRRLDALTREYADRVRSGEQIELSQFLAPHPDLADEFRTWLQEANLLEQLADSSAADSQASTGGQQATDSQDSRETIAPKSFASAELALPCDFGRYCLLRELGQGGMGTVY